MKKTTETSKQAYKEMVEDGKIKPQQQKILDYLRGCGDVALSNREIADAVGLDVDSVKPRVNELRKKGLIFDWGKRRCNFSNKTVQVISAYRKEE